MKTSMILTIASFLTVAVCMTAKADEDQTAPCGPREKVLAALAKDYHETPLAAGIASNHLQVVEILASDDGQSWTILLSKPDGTSCIVADGEDWQAMPLTEKGDPI